jgi:inosine-uridine nucleoside N-ribohydrolase
LTGSNIRIHLDTDLGSDTDDLCALAMLLGWTGVDVIGVTTNTDPKGIRAGYTSYALTLAGRDDIPVVAGAEGSLSSLFVPLAFPDYWPEPIEPRPARSGEAIEVLEAAAGSGATIVAVGPFTNLALLETARPGLLASSNVVVMGGHVTTPRPGMPPLGSDEDFNVQQDRYAAAIVFERVRPVVVPLAVTHEVHLRAAHIPRLRDAGPLARLIADQGERLAADSGRADLGRAFPALPDDLLNFQHDPLAGAVAAGWNGVVVEEIPTGIELGPDRLEMTPSDDGVPLRVVTEVDGRAFEDVWLDSVERASRVP